MLKLSYCPEEPHNKEFYCDDCPYYDEINEKCDYPINDDYYVRKGNRELSV